MDKVVAVLLSFLIYVSSVFAQELSIESPLQYKGGISGAIQTDLNGNKCAKIIVSMPYGGKNIEIECSRKIGDVEKGVGTYSFWVAPPKYQGKQYFIIRTNEFLPLSIDLWSTNGQLIGGHSYEVIVSVPSEVNGSSSEYIGKCELSSDRLEYKTFMLPIFGMSFNKQPSVGLMVGGVKDCGWYVKARTGFFCPINKKVNAPDVLSDGYFLTDEVKKSDLSITGGISQSLGRSPFCLNFGLGYESRMVLQKSFNGEWVKSYNHSHKGIVFECMLLFLTSREWDLLGFSLSAGFSKLLPGKYATVEICVGVNF